MAKYLKDHPYMEPDGLQEQQDDDDFDSERKPYYKENDFTPAQLSVLKNVFDEQYDKIDMDSPEIRKALYFLHKEDLCAPCLNKEQTDRKVYQKQKPKKCVKAL